MVFSRDNLFFLRLEKNHFLLHSTLKLASKMRTLDFGIFIAEKSTLSFIFQAVSRGNEGWPSKKIALKIFSALTKKLFSPLLLATKMFRRFTRQVDSKGCYPSLLPKNLWLLFKIADSKKVCFQDRQYFLAKLSRIGPWVSMVNLCKGHQCDLSHMVIRT